MVLHPAIVNAVTMSVQGTQNLGLRMVAVIY